MIKVLALCLAVCITSVAQTPNEKAVWQQEEAYWQLLHDNQKNSYLALWDERFIGWPRFEANPVGKDGIAPGFAPVSLYKLVPLSVREYGKNVVITFYRASITRNGVSRTSRLSHTWMRSKTGWRIVGGMSADDMTSPK